VILKDYPSVIIIVLGVEETLLTVPIEATTLLPFVGIARTKILGDFTPILRKIISNKK